MWLWHELGLDGASEAHKAARWRRILLDAAQETSWGNVAPELEPFLAEHGHEHVFATLRAGVPFEPALVTELEQRLEAASDDQILSYAHDYAGASAPSSSPSSSGGSSSSSSSSRPRPRKAPPPMAKKKKKKARKPKAHKSKKARKPKARRPKARKPKARKPKARKPKAKPKRKRARTMSFGEFARRMGATLIG